MYVRNGYKIHSSPAEYNVSMLGELIPNKMKKHPCYYNNCGGIDTESTTISHEEIKDKKTGEKHTVIDNCFCYMYQVSIGKHIFLLRYEIELFSLLTQIIESKPYRHTCENGKTTKTKRARVILWCANLAHEFAFLKNMFDKIGITKLFAKTKRNILFIELCNFIEIRECIGLFGNSLSKIAKTYTVTQKLTGDLDYSLIRTNETPLTFFEPYTDEKGLTHYCETDYVINDVAILSELMPTVRRIFIDENISIPYTSTGIIRQQTKKRINNIQAEIQANNNLIIDERTHNIIRAYGYNGGLCGSNSYFVGKRLHNVVCADITSDYPYQINAHFFPCGEMKKIPPTAKNLHWLKNNRKLFYGIFIFGVIESHTTHGCINLTKIMNKQPNDAPDNNLLYMHDYTSSNGKLLYGENVKLCLNDVDITTIKMLYSVSNVKCVELYYFTEKASAPKFLRDNMNYWYIRKAQLKIKLKQLEEQGKKHTKEYKELKVEYDESKKYVNGHYGLCATRLYKDNLMYDNGEFIIDTKSFVDIRKTVWLNPYIAYYCTSWARFELCTFISKYPEIIVQYDTDSLYYIEDEKGEYKKLTEDLTNFNKQVIELNKRIFTEEQYNYCYDIGTWDFDEKYDDFMVLGAKRYIKSHGNDTECVIAGLPKTTLDEWTHENGKQRTKDDIYLYVSTAVQDVVSFSHAVCGKLSSVYYDSDVYKQFEITDYKGNSSICESSGYHALTEIGFEFTIDDMLKLVMTKQMYETIPHSKHPEITELYNKFFTN